MTLFGRGLSPGPSRRLFAPDVDFRTIEAELGSPAGVARGRAQAFCPNRSDRAVASKCARKPSTPRGKPTLTTPLSTMGRRAVRSSVLLAGAEDFRVGPFRNARRRRWEPVPGPGSTPNPFPGASRGPARALIRSRTYDHDHSKREPGSGPSGPANLFQAGNAMVVGRRGTRSPSAAQTHRESRTAAPIMFGVRAARNPGGLYPLRLCFHSAPTETLRSIPPPAPAAVSRVEGSLSCVRRIRRAVLASAHDGRP